MKTIISIIFPLFFLSFIESCNNDDTGSIEQSAGDTTPYQPNSQYQEPSPVKHCLDTENSTCGEGYVWSCGVSSTPATSGPCPIQNRVGACQVNEKLKTSYYGTEYQDAIYGLKISCDSSGGTWIPNY